KLTGALVAELWAKVLYNAALNPLGALLGVPYGDLPADRDTRMIMDAVIEEAFAVARAEGVELAWPDAAADRDVFYGRLVPPRARVKAFYHSHTRVGAYFSGEDRARAMFGDEPAYPEVTYVVVSDSRTPGEVRAFRWDEGARDFVEVPIEVC